MPAMLTECPPCRMAPQSSARLFLQETTEGLGARLTNFIYGMAVAARSGLNL